MLPFIIFEMSIFLVNSSLIWELGQPSLYPGFDSWKGQEISLFLKMISPAVGPIQPPTQYVSRALPLPQKGEGVTGPEPEVNRSRLCTAEDKNEWHYTSTSPTCLQGHDRNNFTLLYDQFISTTCAMIC